MGASYWPHRHRRRSASPAVPPQQGADRYRGSPAAARLDPPRRWSPRDQCRNRGCPPYAGCSCSPPAAARQLEIDRHLCLMHLIATSTRLLPWILSAASHLATYHLRPFATRWAVSETHTVETVECIRETGRSRAARWEVLFIGDAALLRRVVARSPWLVRC